MTHDAPIIKAEELMNLNGKRIVVLVSEWNEKITEAMCNACCEMLRSKNIHAKNLLVYHVPGSFELPVAASWVLNNDDCDAIICLGCVMKGETSHFDFISQSVTDGIMKLNLEQDIPVIMGVITPHNMDQALARSGGNVGNKGTEAAVAAIKMIALKEKLNSN